jgi:AAA15 family ATPase/GTPase
MIGEGIIKMNENFITEIEIKNFKCFDDFKANGFKRVNLIVGKNNVGKTALMEACWIYEQNKNSANVIEAFVNLVNTLTLIREFRDLLNYEHHDLQGAFSILKKFNRMLIKSNNQSVKLNIEINTDEVKVEINDFEIGTSLTNSNLFENSLSDRKSFSKNFIPSCKIDNDLMIILYDHIKENRKRDELNQYIRQFDRDLLEFEIINNLPKVFLDSRQQFEDIAELGHGLKRYVSIISAILVCQESCLFLDEIENGIHYTQLDRLWRIILTLSEELNCQIFATTHSKECIESYYKVSKEMAYKNVSYIKMNRLKRGQISSSVYDYELLENSLEQNHEVRGW